MKKSYVFLIFATLALAAAVGSYPPLATTNTAGLIKPDGTTCTTSGGVLTCPGSGSSGALVKLCSQTLTNTTQPTIIFSPSTCGGAIISSTYNVYELILSNVQVSGGANNHVEVRLSNDSGSSYDNTNYITQGFVYNGTSVISESNTSDDGMFLTANGSSGGPATMDIVDILSNLQVPSQQSILGPKSFSNGSFVNNNGFATYIDSPGISTKYVGTSLPVNAIEVISDGSVFQCMAGQICSATFYGVTP